MSADEHEDIAPGPERAEPRVGQGPDLEADALAAAAEAIARGEQALREVPAGLLALPDGPPRARGRRIALRAILLVNLVLMGVMLALPEPEPAGAPRPAPPGGARPDPTPAPPAGVEVSRRMPAGSRGAANDRGDPWISGVMLFADGNYAEAAERLLEYERLNPQMVDGRRLDLYAMLGTCLLKAGRIEDAARYRARSRALDNRGYLPEDLRDAARSAWDGGRYDEARRYYARFLLQQKQLPAGLRESVAEAYLRIGDSYRMAAGVAEAR